MVKDDAIVRPHDEQAITGLTPAEADKITWNVQDMTTRMADATVKVAQARYVWPTAIAGMFGALGVAVVVVVGLFLAYKTDFDSTVCVGLLVAIPATLWGASPLLKAARNLGGGEEK